MTTSIGRRCERGDTLSRAALMARRLPLESSLSPCAGFPRPVEAAERKSGGYGAGAHLFPFRTEKLSPAATMILRETVGK